MQVSEIMNKDLSTASINDSIKSVAQLMRQEDIGAVPVIDNDQAIGIITDRDIVINCVAQGSSLDQPISEAMTKDVLCVRENDDVEEASRLMKNRQVSRVVVINESKKPVGMLSLHDLTKFHDDSEKGEILSDIKQ